MLVGDAQLDAVQTALFQPGHKALPEDLVLVVSDAEAEGLALSVTHAGRDHEPPSRLPADWCC